MLIDAHRFLPPIARAEPRARPNASSTRTNVRVAEEGIYVLAHYHCDNEVKIFLADRLVAVDLTDEWFRS
jgi:hypothetical protein